MCDYDWDYEEISSRMVRIRKQQECGSCMGRFPKGTIMKCSVGKTDGEIGRTYACAACEFALNQPDETPLHLCWGWNWDYEDMHGTPKHEYITECLDKGETPTEAGLEKYLTEHLAKEDA